MDTGGDRGERDENAVGGGSGISRRRFVAGGLFAISGTSLLVDGGTRARFIDSGAAAGTVRIDAPATLNYQISDETENNKAAYDIACQVEWLADFDHIDITVNNTADGSSESFSSTNPEGTFSTNEYGGHAGDTFEFVFEVYDGPSSIAIQESVTDVADGDGQSQGDMGTVDDTKLQSITVVDGLQNNKANYTVEYELSNVQPDFQDVLVTFDNVSETDWGDATRTNTSSPTGSVSFSKGGTKNDDYEITVEVRNTNGITVDSVTVADTVDGNNSSWTA